MLIDLQPVEFGVEANPIGIWNDIDTLEIEPSKSPNNPLSLTPALKLILQPSTACRQIRKYH